MDQVNALVPLAALSADLTLPAQPLTITRDNTQSLQPPQISLTALQPEIFMSSLAGLPNQGAVLNNANGSLAAPVGTAVPGSAPAAVGSYIQIYCNGLGPVTNQPPDGMKTPQMPYSYTKTPPQVFIDHQPAQVIFSGLAPGFVSLYQVNVQVPDVSPGDQVPVYIMMGTQSNIVTIAVSSN
jgi:uncharacterized protein (TIGR03437 family)